MTAPATEARDIHRGDVIVVDGTAMHVDSKRTVDLDGLVAITYHRGSRSGVLVRARQAAVTCLYHAFAATVCISCELANHSLSRGSHCGRCTCCPRRTP